LRFRGIGQNKSIDQDKNDTDDQGADTDIIEKIFFFHISPFKVKSL